MSILQSIKEFVKKSPIPLTKNHGYDIRTTKIINSLHQESNCIDIGCHKGEILDLMISAAPKGHHFGIEPIPNLYEKLKSKYENHENCTILNYAASNYTGSSTFNYVTSNPAYSGLKKRSYDRPDEKDKEIKVQVDLLDNLIPKYIKIDLIKIDVEGAEMQVLEGAKRIMESDRPIVIFEHGLGASDVYGTTPDQIYNFFDSYYMNISNLKAYIKKKKSLSRMQFENEYYQKKNYYFIAHM